MRLFKGQSFFHRASGKAISKAGAADDSFGSDISTKDQFDIVVPVKTPKVSHSWGGFLEKDDSTVSSITTSNEINNINQVNQTNDVTTKAQADTKSSTSSSWCCCSPMNSTANDDPTSSSGICYTGNTADAVVTSEREPPATADAAAVAASPTTVPTQRQSNPWCCSGTEVSGNSMRTQVEKRHKRTSSSFIRHSSLFDVLDEEEDIREPPVSSSQAGNMKKLKNCVRRAIPLWGRQRSKSKLPRVDQPFEGHYTMRSTRSAE